MIDPGTNVSAGRDIKERPSLSQKTGWCKPAYQ